MKGKKNAGDEQLTLFEPIDPDEPIPYSLTQLGRDLLADSEPQTWKD